MPHPTLACRATPALLLALLLSAPPAFAANGAELATTESGAGKTAITYPPVQADRPLTFPADHGAHPDYRIEWWYLTGWIDDESGASRGFQLTFFRLRPGAQEDNPSAFAPRQLLFAHAAVSDPTHGRLRHAERSARAGFGLAGADEGDTRVTIGDWSLAREAIAGGDRYRARAAGDGFAFELLAVANQPPLLQGEAGYSRKGPLARHASYYYSRPQLAVEGRLTLGGREHRVRGRAWLDHEWSSEAMPPGAVGWDWVGANLDDGGALMAFRLRDAAGATLWSAATLAPADGPARRFGPAEVDFTPLRRWRSPRSGGDYAVETEVRVGSRRYRLLPLFDDQELDSRGSVGAVYWEGAVRVQDELGRPAGLGYLEVTGALAPLKL